MLSTIKTTIKNHFKNEQLLLLLAISCFIYSLYIAIVYANQVPLDLFSFRQTQTALSAYWLIKNGFSLAYETPVAGLPWSIPFEFPIYQYIVALISKFSGLSLNGTGRIVSYLFLVLCLIPAKSITRQLNFPKTVLYIFTALLFSSPIYLYWGRSFMIETTTLFFAIVAIKYFLDIIQEKKSCSSPFLFMFFITLSILQKATTGLPVLAILCGCYVLLNIQKAHSIKNVLFSKKSILALIYFGIPLSMGILWTLYTDHVKELNGMGIALTSKALNGWNWGTLKQRLSFDFYHNIIWGRIFVRNLSGVLGIAILVMALCSNAKKQIKFIIAISLLLGLVPLFLFTNLHIVHEYYQAANIIFIIYAVAVSLGCALNKDIYKIPIIFLITLIMVAFNYHYFSKNYIEVIKTVYNKDTSRDYAVSDILKREIPEGKYFVAFGNDWSSSYAYLSERKSFTTCSMFKKYKEMSLHPEHFIDEMHLGAVIICPHPESPRINDLVQWSSTDRNWKIGEASGCYIASPETPLAIQKPITQTNCQGNIDFAGDLLPGDKDKIISVTGWTTVSGEKGHVPEKVYISLTQKNRQPIFLEALQINRADINSSFGKPNLMDSGFSRIINSRTLSGKYSVGIVRVNNGHFEACQFKKTLVIND